MLLLLLAVYVHCVRGDDTCCYGQTCPLPIWNQYLGNFTKLYQWGIYDYSSCCPNGGAIRYTTNGDISTSCRCHNSGGYIDQTCDGVQGSNALTCDGGWETDEGCPDSHVGTIDENGGGCISLGYGCYCTYGRDQYTAGNTQRCLPRDVCFERNGESGGYLEGTYVSTGTFYNGFPSYQYTVNTSWYLRVGLAADGYPVWMISDKFDYFYYWFPTGIPTVYQIGSFNDITTLKDTVNEVGNKVSFTEGVCVTPYPTGYPSAIATPNPTASPTNSGSSASSDSGGETLVIVFIGLAVAAFVIGPAVVALHIWRKRKQSEMKSNFVKMSTVQNE